MKAGGRKLEQRENCAVATVKKSNNEHYLMDDQSLCEGVQ